MLRSSLLGMLAFVLFVLLYWSPLMLDFSATALHESHVGQLLDELLGHGAVRTELVRNLLAVLALQGAACLGCYWLGAHLARRWSLRLSVVFLLLLFMLWLALLSGNAWLFPNSNYAVALQALTNPFWALVSIGLLLAAIVHACWPFAGRRSGAVAGSLVVVLAGVWGSSSLGEQAMSRERSVILIGVDSLSANAFENNSELLPTVAKLLSNAAYYERAYTPLGRTFPAWVSVLSGKLPAEHGAVFNLRNLEHVERQGLLTRTLQGLGYHRVFAIDERRFANIDESFGFDRVVGPKAGALDFVLQGINDNPFSNFLLQTPLGAYLFPYSYVNVAAHVSYSAKGFVDRVLAAVGTDKPLFLAVHFESGHFPYKTRHALSKVLHSNPFMASYLEAMTVVDWQVGQLLAGLKARGKLDDALVVVLSDHGEALGEVEANLERDGQLFELKGYGHGIDLLSDRQNRIVLGVLRFRQGEPVSAPATHLQQVSLLDIRGLVEAFAHTGRVETLQGNQCLMVETGIRLAATEDYRSIKEGEVVAQAAGLYELDVQGRLRLREESLPGLLESKDIGWRCTDRITWYAAAEKRYLSYSLDVQGKPVERAEPDADVVARIAEYRRRYAQ